MNEGVSVCVGRERSLVLGWRNSVVREQVERRGGAEVYAGKGKDRKELKKAHRLEPSREPAIQLPVSHTTAA